MSLPTRGVIYWPIERDDRGWPKDASEVLRTWLASEVTAILRNHGSKPLWLIVELVDDDARGSEHPAAREWRQAVVKDWRWAAVERALRAVDAEPRYHLKGE